MSIGIWVVVGVLAGVLASKLVIRSGRGPPAGRRSRYSRRGRRRLDLQRPHTPEATGLDVFGLVVTLAGATAMLVVYTCSSRTSARRSRQRAPRRAAALTACVSQRRPPRPPQLREQPLAVARYLAWFGDAQQRYARRLELARLEEVPAALRRRAVIRRRRLRSRAAPRESRSRRSTARRRPTRAKRPSSAPSFRPHRIAASAVSARVGCSRRASAVRWSVAASGSAGRRRSLGIIGRARHCAQAGGSAGEPRRLAPRRLCIVSAANAPAAARRDPEARHWRRS